MKIVNLGKKNTIFNHFISEIRDVDIQKDSMRFRRNLERIGEVFAYEISKELEYGNKQITTPLGIAEQSLIIQKPVLATVLRAGLPLHQGLLNYFDDADSAFISAYRNHVAEEDFSIEIEYIASPDINNKVVIIADPMIATGKSIIMALESILTKGTPKSIHIIGVIVSSDGIGYLQRNMNFNHCTLWVGAEDSQIDACSYIIPGLGDAGDLSFGPKL